jgi:hypothetical protein
MAGDLFIVVYVPPTLEFVTVSLSALNQVAVGACNRPLILVTMQMMLRGEPATGEVSVDTATLRGFSAAADTSMSAVHYDFVEDITQFP